MGLAVFLVGLKTCCSNRALSLEECKDTEGLPQKISTSSTRLGRHDPQTILSWLDISVSSSPPKPLADELLTERLPPEVTKLSET